MHWRVIRMTPINNSNHIDLFYTLLTSHRSSLTTNIGTMELSTASAPKSPKSPFLPLLPPHRINSDDVRSVFWRFRVLDYSLPFFIGLDAQRRVLSLHLIVSHPNVSWRMNYIFRGQNIFFLSCILKMHAKLILIEFATPDGTLPRMRQVR